MYENFIHLAPMVVVSDSASQVADFLLQIKAVKLRPNEPFEWASGWQSPIYCDNRLILSFPDVRTYVRQELVKLIERSHSGIDCIAGVATGGIGIGALVAQEMGLPFCYVRSASKGHGLQNQIEGRIDAGTSCIVVEDLISTGGSSLKAVKTLRDAGVEVRGMTAIFTYGFDKSKEAFEESDVQLSVLADYTHLVRKALETDYIQENQLNDLEEWRVDPSNWKKIRRP